MIKTCLCVSSYLSDKAIIHFLLVFEVILIDTVIWQTFKLP